MKRRRRSVRRRRLGAAIESLEQRQMLTFAIDLFADINQLGVSSNIEDLVTVGSDNFFVADDGLSGSELWKSDGTTGGTTLVRDVLPGPDTSSPQDLTNVDGVLYFTALDENGETDLWSSDGTESGTTLVFDADASGVYYLTDLTASGGKLFFTAYEPATGYELWMHDPGTQATSIVLDINPDQLIIDRPQELTDVGGTLFFTSYDDGYYNRELWMSDGTAVGTMMVRDLGVDPGPDGILGTADDDATFSSNPSYLTEVNGELFFVAEDYEYGIELFKSDGTMGGTMMVSDLNPGGSSYPYDLTSFENQVFFSAVAAGNDRHVYRSDGSTITLVADTTRGLGSSSPSDFEVVGNELFFASNGAVPATMIENTLPELTDRNSTNFFAGLVAETTSNSNGTLSFFGGTQTFNAINQGGSDDGPGWVSSGSRPGAAGVGLSNIAIGDLYLQTLGASELDDFFWEWTISDPGGLTNISFDGFASGNQMNNETNEGLVFELFLNGSNTRTSFIEIDGSVGESGGNKNGDALDNWYGARDDMNLSLQNAGGASVTSATIRMSLGVIDGNGNFQQRIPDGGSEAFLVNAQLTADLGENTTLFNDAGRELHKISAGTFETEMVSDIVPVGSSAPTQLTAVGNKLFFEADDVTGAGRELWVSDGTEAGTMLVVDSLPGNDLYSAPLDGSPTLLGSIGGDLLFTTTNANRDRELWVANAASMTAQEIANINTATGDANAQRLQADGNLIYFAANDGLNGEAVWVADTVAETTMLLEDISPSSTDKILGLQLVQPIGFLGPQVMYFNNSLGTTGGVYITDPVGNTIQLSDLRPVELNADGDMFFVNGSEIYFVTNDGVSGEEIWVTDGTTTAVLAFDINPGSDSSNPRELVEYGGNLFFVANSENNGRELHVIFGDNPTLAADIDPGSDSSNPSNLTVSNNVLYFTASDGTGGSNTGQELWSRTNTGVTSIVTDIRPGGIGSNPTNFADINNALYFSADNGTDGVEPYRVTGPNSVVQVANVNPTGSSNAGNFMQALGSIYFAADNGTDGTELYKTDGTPGGTELVADVQSGPEGSDPVPLFDTGQRLLFNASGIGVTDREFWSTDGTVGNAFQVEDTYPSEFFGADPEQILPIGDKVFFIGENGLSGRELFMLEERDVTVTEVIVGGDLGTLVGANQRSNIDLVRVVLEGRVDVPDSAITLRNRNTDTVLTSVISNVVYDPATDQTVVELTFGSGPSVRDRDTAGTSGLRNALEDGNYQLTLNGAQVTSPVSGATLGADFDFGTVANDNFFALFGNTDVDRDVDGQDFGRVAQTFFKTGNEEGYNPDLDFDGDSDFDGQDFGNFATRFLTDLDFV